MISINGLVKKYDSVLALDGLDLEIPKGDFVALMGPSGFGE